MTPLVVENEPPVTFLRRKMTGGRFSMGVVIRRYTGIPISVSTFRCAFNGLIISFDNLRILH